MTLRPRKGIAVLAAAALLTLTGCGSALEKSYEAGEVLLEQGKYEEAAEKYRELGSYEDASRLLMYSRAVLAAESGDYDTACRAFTALGSFRDAPQMLRYYEGREAEADGRNALDRGAVSEATPLLIGAAQIYGELPEFPDARERGEACLKALYDRGRALLDRAEYYAARDVFAALETAAYKSGSADASSLTDGSSSTDQSAQGDAAGAEDTGTPGDAAGSADAAGLKAYCEACLLEAEGEYLEAAARLSGIPDVLDAEARADADRDVIYQKALAVSEEGDREGAIALLTALGSFRDAEAMRDSTVRQLIQDRLREGDYEGALFQMDASPDVIDLQPADDSAKERLSSFLDGFVGAYLHFSAGTVDSWSGYHEVLPYIEAGGALDGRFLQVTMIGSYGHNTNYNYYGSELLDLFAVGENCYLAYIRASASANQPVGPVYVNRTFRILLKDTEAGPAAGSIEDCLYGTDNPNGRLTVSGPLPDGKLPPDEDGDGILIIDVMKKGFCGTMIVVLDPSRVFAGGPGFYGGNGMLLEDLVRRYDALGGINGGGFIDEGGGGTGGLPEGLTIVDGKSYHWADSGASAAFDEENVLHVGYFSVETAEAAGIRDCVSFGPALITDGDPEYGDYMESGINPRTAIGQREDGAVLMLCIDGRQIHSIGASFGDLRDVMLDFGAVNACSLDGGSSTVMYFDGEYVNSPSSASGTSRYLPNAFLIRK